MTCVRWALKLIVPLAVLAAVSPAADNQKMYSVSFPQLKGAGKGERVVAFEIKVTAGGIRSVSNVPMGWNLVIDNDASWQTTIHGNVEVGAAALEPADFRRLTLTVERNEFGDLKFELAGVVSVTAGFDKARQIHLAMGDFAVSLTR